RVLRGWLATALPAATRAAISPDLDALGLHAAEAWVEARGRASVEPELVQWDASGRRIDRIGSTPAWRNGRALAARFGLVAAGHEEAHGEFARCDQFARVYLHHVASEFFTCPLAMSDGAATALKAVAESDQVERLVPRLVSRDVDTLWLSGQWMTETAGGSDVARTATRAEPTGDGRWRLHGRKWFTSAVIGEMALALARPARSAAIGSDALGLFVVETRDADGRWNGIRIDRLKDKLGTRELPTAEIHLEGTLARAVGEASNGVRHIAPMLNVTRLWNAVCAVATMRRCIERAVAFAGVREAFGRTLHAHPLHMATLADLQASFEAAFHLVFHAAHLLGRAERHAATDDEVALLRILTPLAKLWTGRLAVGVASECCEAFGGAGYIEDGGMPRLLRDAQVFPIWEGTTNVLALDVQRAIAGPGFEPLRRHAEELVATADVDAVRAIRASLDGLEAWLRGSDDIARAAEARRFAFSLARTLAAASLARHAARANGDPRPALALTRFIGHGLSRLPARRIAPADALSLFDPAGT
ncbi:MAG: acyl-CoA dehydrogenase family protein, partial [Xanthomonadales bacterium]|nr:acyl-CoA dehydrogenase family protein [Xanthomonadales bacterium]